MTQNVSIKPGTNDTKFFEIVVAHVNHMIREEASDDETFVREFCKKIGVQFYSKSIDVKKIANNNKIGLEEARKNCKI